MSPPATHTERAGPSRRLTALALFLLAAGRVVAAAPLGHGFTYEGRLSAAGQPGNGAYDFEFELFDALTGGNAVGSVVSLTSVPVASGLFTVTLDFGGLAFSGQKRWLEIRLRPAGSGGYTALSPRQELTPTPNALWTSRARDAQTLDGIAPSGYRLAGTVIPISEGGTGATDAPAARANLQAARSGTNSDITSITGLTTPLALTGGGTSAATPAGALVALNAQARVTGTCPAGQYVRVVNSDGTVVCGTDTDTNSGGTVTSVATGAGLTGGPITTAGTISIPTGGVTSSLIANGAVGLTQINTSQVQARLTTTCNSGQYLSAVNADGSVVCSNVFDSSPATVVNVSLSASDGAYTVGSSLPVLVLFSKPVAVSGNPTLTLETGTTDAVADYSHSPSPNLLAFTYTVEAGHTTGDLDYMSTTALALNGGTIQNLGGAAADLTLPAPGGPGSISANKDIAVDTTAPVVSNVTSTVANGSYTSGEVIDVRVTFSEGVTVVGTPRITLETGPTDAVVNYSSGSGTSTLVFNYTVGPTHASPDLDYVSAGALVLNGGTIRDAVGNDATLTLPAPGGTSSLGLNKDIVVVDAPPVVTNVTSTTANGTYAIGGVIAVQVVFNEPVVVTGTPRLTLETGASDAVVDYTSGSGASTLTFNYTVAAGHASADLDYVSAGALALNGGTIRDSAANDAVLTLSTPGTAGSLGANKSIVIDGVAPTVTNVTSSTANGTYAIDAVIAVQVVFTQAVVVTGTPQLTLETGASDAVVNYASGTGTSTLTFNYTVAAGHASANLDYVSTGALALNGGTIRDTATNNAVLTLPTPGTAGSLGQNKNFVIDGVAPTVTDVTSSAANGTYVAGAVIAVQVVFTQSVIVIGTPQMTLETGASDALVNYSSGSGSNALTFNYTVAAGHASADLDYVSPVALALNGGTIRDSATNNAVLTLAAPGTAGSLGANTSIVIDGVAPSVTNVTSTTANGTYGVGGVIVVQVVFNEPVVVTGTPRLTLETGTTDAVVDYASGSGSSTLLFTYTVGAGHASADLDYVSPFALALNGGTIRDSASNNAVLMLPTPGTPGSLGANKNIVIDGVAPTVLNVTSPVPDGNYGVGQVIPIHVVFAESVFVTGLPQLTLETGPADAIVAYSSGSGTPILVFNYTVVAGHTTPDLDYVSAASLAVVVGTIRDAANNNAVVTLPAPGGPGSLAFSKNIIIP